MTVSGCVSSCFDPAGNQNRHTGIHQVSTIYNEVRSASLPSSTTFFVKNFPRGRPHLQNLRYFRVQDAVHRSSPYHYLCIPPAPIPLCASSTGCGHRCRCNPEYHSAGQFPRSSAGSGVTFVNRLRINLIPILATTQVDITGLSEPQSKTTLVEQRRAPVTSKRSPGSSNGRIRLSHGVKPIPFQFQLRLHSRPSGSKTFKTSTTNSTLPPSAALPRFPAPRYLPMAVTHTSTLPSCPFIRPL